MTIFKQTFETSVLLVTPMKKRFLPICCATLLALTWHTQTVQAEVLDGQSIRALVTGETLSVRRNGLTMRLTLNADGSAQGRMGPMQQTGSWSVEGDQLCIDMPRRPANFDRCQTLEQFSANRLQGSNGLVLTIE